MFLDELKSMVESNEGYKLVTVHWYLSKKDFPVIVHNCSLLMYG